jgi:hypothetical protein
MIVMAMVCVRFNNHRRVSSIHAEQAAQIEVRRHDHPLLETFQECSAVVRLLTAGMQRLVARLWQVSHGFISVVGWWAGANSLSGSGERAALLHWLELCCFKSAVYSGPQSSASSGRKTHHAGRR